MKKILPLLLAILLLAGCGKGELGDVQKKNTLAKALEKHSSFSITTTLADGTSYFRYYEPRISYFDRGGIQSVYTAAGAYCHADGRFYVPIFIRESYSSLLLKERIISPIIAESARVSRVTDRVEEGEFTTIKTRPSESYKNLIYEEYEITQGTVTIDYVVQSDSAQLVKEIIYVDGKVFATLDLEYGVSRPEIADKLIARLDTPANQCRTVTVTLDGGTDDQRIVSATTAKGDGFKFDAVPNGYINVYSNVGCTIPYQSKGSDLDAKIFLAKGK